jgi:hypothetical protein
MENGKAMQRSLITAWKRVIQESYLTENAYIKVKNELALNQATDIWGLIFSISQLAKTVIEFDMLL